MKCRLLPHESRFVWQLHFSVTKYSSIRNGGSLTQVRLRRVAFGAHTCRSFLYLSSETTTAGQFPICLFHLLWGAKVRATCRPEIPNIFFSRISLLLRKPVNWLKHLTWGNTEVTFNSETNCLWFAKEKQHRPERAVDQNREGKTEGREGV